VAAASAATTEESTPPDMATTMRLALSGASSWKSPAVMIAGI
jgi:hypothetical protein